MARRRPGLDPAPLSPKEIADRAEAGADRRSESKAAKARAAAVVERTVEKPEKTDRLMTKHEFYNRTGFDRHTIDDWILKGMPSEKVRVGFDRQRSCVSDASLTNAFSAPRLCPKSYPCKPLHLQGFFILNSPATTL